MPKSSQKKEIFAIKTERKEYEILAGSVYYSLGGYNYFSGNKNPRGYYFDVWLMERYPGGTSMRLFADAGIKMFLAPAERFSKKVLESTMPTEEQKDQLIGWVVQKNGLKLGKSAVMGWVPVVSEYTDAQAVDDGVLVNVELFGWKAGDLKPINRITSAIWEAIKEESGGEITDKTSQIGYRMAVAAQQKLEDDWYTGEYEGKKLWLVPNELGGRTLMFPEDY